MALIYFFDINNDRYVPEGEYNNWSFKTGMDRINNEISDQTKYPGLSVLYTQNDRMVIGFGGRTEFFVLSTEYTNSRVYLYLEFYKDETLVYKWQVDNYSTSICFSTKQLQNNGVLFGIESFALNSNAANNYEKYLGGFIDDIDETSIGCEGNYNFKVYSKHGLCQYNTSLSQYTRFDLTAQDAVQLCKLYDYENNVFLNSVYIQTVGNNTKRGFETSTCKIGNKYYYLWNPSSVTNYSCMQLALECTDKITT